METNKKLIDNWIDILRRSNIESNRLLGYVSALKSYKRSIDFYDECEIDLPQWLDQDMEKFFVELELSLKPEDYRR